MLLREIKCGFNKKKLKYFDSKFRTNKKKFVNKCQHLSLKSTITRANLKFKCQDLINKEWLTISSEFQWQSRGIQFMSKRSQ